MYFKMLFGKGKEDLKKGVKMKEKQTKQNRKDF